MKFGEIFKGLFAKKPAQETPEQIQARLAGIEENIQNITQFRQAPDSSSATRAADEERLRFLEERRQEVMAKLPTQPASETQAASVSTGSVTTPNASTQSASTPSTPSAGEGEKAA